MTHAPGLRLTHIGGPTVLIEVGGWRLLTDPTFDPAGKSYSFGWGTGSRKVAGPAVPAAELGTIDAVLLTHDHHDDNLDPAGRALLPSAGYTMTARDAVKLCTEVRPRTAIPVHYEGWAHFQEGRDAVERELEGAPEEVRRSFRWLPIGTAVDLSG